jgi:serine protease
MAKSIKKRWILGLLLLVGLGWAAATWQGLQGQGSFNSIVVDFREDSSSKIPEQIEQVVQTLKLRLRLNSEFSETDHIYVVDGNRTVLQALQQSDLGRYTEYIEPNYLYSIPEASQAKLPISGDRSATAPPAKTAPYPNDPLYSEQWNLKSIGMEVAWAITKGKGVTIAVIDTGIAKVPDINDLRVTDGYDFINDEPSATDDQGHGTHVAGTIAQNTHNGYGAAGIAPAARLMPLKVLAVGGSGGVADIAEAIRWAADRNADVINLSMAGTGYSRLMQKAIDYAYRKGLVVVAAAGNDHRNAVSFPARYRHVIGVAALDDQGQPTPYSNFGAGVDLAAPGGLIKGTGGGIIQNTFDPHSKESLFTPYQGSSFAAPHVAGVAALIQSLKKLDPDTVEALLTSTAQKPQADPLNHFGAGQLNAAAALERAKLVIQSDRSSVPLPKPDFFRQLADQGYLGRYWWIDGDRVPVVVKLVMLGWALFTVGLLWARGRLRWTGLLLLGLFFGSCGLFVLQGLYWVDQPQWIFRLLGSALPEINSALEGSSALNPVSASALIPLLLTFALFRSPRWKPLALGVSLGVAAFLLVSTVRGSAVVGMGDGPLGRLFLFANTFLCYGVAAFLLRPTPPNNLVDFKRKAASSRGPSQGSRPLKGQAKGQAQRQAQGQSKGQAQGRSAAAQPPTNPGQPAPNPPLEVPTAHQQPTNIQNPTVLQSPTAVQANIQNPTAVQSPTVIQSPTNIQSGPPNATPGSSPTALQRPTELQQPTELQPGRSADPNAKTADGADPPAST